MRHRSSPDRPTRRPWTAVVLEASVATLERPVTWPLALTSFLARGGILAFLLPILVVPTPAGLQAELAPLLVPFVFGQPAVGLVRLVVAGVLLTAAALIVGGLLGAWSERLLIREAGEGAPLAALGRRTPVRGLAHVLVARLLAHIPLALALAWGSVRIAEVFYREVTVPFEVATPVALRVLNAVPGSILAIVAAWLLGEAAAAIAAREVVLAGRSGPAAAARGWLSLARRPLSSLATIVATNLVVALALVPALVAASAAWSRVRMLLWDDAPGMALAFGIGIFVALWLGGLVLAAGATAWRSLTWTGEWLRHRTVVPSDGDHDVVGVPLETTGTAGTIGADTRRPGGWPTTGTSGRL